MPYHDRKNSDDADDVHKKEWQFLKVLLLNLECIHTSQNELYF